MYARVPVIPVCLLHTLPTPPTSPALPDVRLVYAATTNVMAHTLVAMLVAVLPVRSAAQVYVVILNVPSSAVKPAPLVSHLVLISALTCRVLHHAQSPTGWLEIPTLFLT